MVHRDEKRGRNKAIPPLTLPAESQFAKLFSSKIDRNVLSCNTKKVVVRHWTTLHCQRPPPPIEPPDANGSTGKPVSQYVIWFPIPVAS